MVSLFSIFSIIDSLLGKEGKLDIDNQQPELISKYLHYNMKSEKHLIEGILKD